MGRVLGSWLSGPAAARTQDDTDRPRWRGERLGLPESGVGSAAPLGRRTVAFIIDIVLGGLVAALFTAPNLPGNWSVLAWFLITAIPVSFFGFTPGMALSRIWVTRLDGAAMVGVPRAVLRSLLTLFLIPAVLWNLDGRSWHDRLTGTVVVRR